MAVDRKYGKVLVEKKNIPEDEPVFVIRAQDILSGLILRYYAILYLSVTNDSPGFMCILQSACVSYNLPRW